MKPLVELTVPEAGRPDIFHHVPRRPGCPFCSGDQAPRGLAPAVDAAYCISLRDQPHRAERASALFHEIGLCRDVIFYRPARGDHFARAVWASHRAVARHAEAGGAKRVLLLEDDVGLPRNWPRHRDRIFRAIERLPEGWWALFLGHFPLQAYFVRPDIMRVRSLTTHAYIANAPLLRWLVETDPLDPCVAAARGLAIDSAYANLPGMYALFPMVASQQGVDPPRAPAGPGRTIPRFEPGWYGEVAKLYGLKPAEWASALLSPVHRLTLEFFRSRSGRRRSRDAQDIVESGLFDERFYRESYPDLAASAMSSMPLLHFLLKGAAEGRNPHPLFDTRFYLGQNPALSRDENPLAHFVRSGAREKLDPHPSFSTARYLDSCPDVARSGLNPLVHYLRYGAAEGRTTRPPLGPGPLEQ